MFMSRATGQQPSGKLRLLDNVHDMMNVIQCTLVLLGNVNELVLQTLRCNILQCVDKSLVKYDKDLAPKNPESLFGLDCCFQLKTQVKSVKTFSQVVSLAHRYPPMRNHVRQP